eukprot:2225012-Pleurochrysis_carterae.AAC.2
MRQTVSLGWCHAHFTFVVNGHSGVQIGHVCLAPVLHSSSFESTPAGSAAAIRSKRINTEGSDAAALCDKRSADRATSPTPSHSCKNSAFAEHGHGAHEHSDGKVGRSIESALPSSHKGVLSGAHHHSQRLGNERREELFPGLANGEGERRSAGVAGADAGAAAQTDGWQARGDTIGVWAAANCT